MAAPNSARSEFHVPTVDIRPYILHPSSREAARVVAEINHACKTTGFFQLVGHGIPHDLQDMIFRSSAAFFALPDEEKTRLLRDKDGGPMTGGYEVRGSQGSENGKLPDLSESFYITRECRGTCSDELDCGSIKSPNYWPSSSVLPDETFKSPMVRYHQEMFKLSLLILQILASGLPHGPNIFDDFVTGDVVASLRLLHYPPQETSDERQLGVGAHTDYGAITLLLQDETPGLQVYNDADKIWVPIPPKKDAYVVNIGDMLAIWTQGVFKSGLHRVINRSTKDRYSLPYFFDGNLKCALAPFDGSLKKLVLTVEEHIRARRMDAYSRGSSEKNWT